MQDDGCRNWPTFDIRHPTFSIQAAFFSSLLTGDTLGGTLRPGLPQTQPRPAANVA
jgi:hypothetical protein